MGRPWPNEVRLRSKEKVFEIDFEDGQTFAFPAEFLRIQSPSAEMRGHGTGPGKLIGGRRHVGILKVEPVGNYAVRLHFDDLHDTGLYSWAYLYELGLDQDARWRHYLAALEERGFNRDP